MLLAAHLGMAFPVDLHAICSSCGLVGPVHQCGLGVRCVKWLLHSQGPDDFHAKYSKSSKA